VLRLTFLGTSAAAPTLNRGLSGLALRRAGELLLFDCGEGTQRQMIRYGTGFDVAAIFFSHFHADHWLGAVGFLRTLSMLGRAQPLHLYGPKPARRFLGTMLFAGTDALSFPVEIEELEPGAEVRRGGAAIRAFATEHRIPSLGWALAEDPRPGRFHPDRARALGVPEGPLWGELQHGRAVKVDGRTVSPEGVVGPARPGRTVVVTGDTRPSPATVAAARGADLLIHDGTFGDAEQARALETFHSTAREAGRVAREAGARRLVLTHLSTRYDADPSPLVAQAGEEFPGAEVAHDGLAIEVPQVDDPGAAPAEGG
jgi:ribonuclease Z